MLGRPGFTDLRHDDLNPRNLYTLKVAFDDFQQADILPAFTVSGE